MMTIPAPILTVDVEEWFHVCGDPTYSDPGSWEGREKRVHVGVDKVLSILSGTRSRATFFVLGWVARKSPSLVRKIADAGHEIGSHGDLHRRLFEMSLEELREDVRRSKGTLEDITGSPVDAFRAPEWSMRTPRNPALAILVEEGFSLDSSLVPAPPVGLATNPEVPTILETHAGPILEVPPLMGTFFFRKAMLGGGVCSRMSRESRVLGRAEELRRRGIPPVFYLHPWELDDRHPPMSLPPLARLIHFGGRRRIASRLARWVTRYDFAPISSARAALQAAACEPSPGIIGAAA